MVAFMTEKEQTTYSISELAKEFDITTRSIRFYEDQGLLTPQRQGQTRIYSKRDRVRLKLILRGKRFGFSLEDIRQLLGMYDRDPGQQAAQLARTYAMAESEKLAGAVSGFTPEQIVQQCQAFGPVLQPQLPVAAEGKA